MADTMTEWETARRLHGLIAELSVAALQYTSQPRIEATARRWLAGANLEGDDPRSIDTVALALALASELALFAPSASGLTAVDRLVRQHKVDGEEALALAALQGATFRILRIEARDSEGLFRLSDLATGKVVRLYDDQIPPTAIGLSLVALLCPLGDGAFVAAGPLTPLDDAALAVALGFVRPGGRGVGNPHRCAESVYRHVVRHGGLNALGPGVLPEEDEEFPYGPETSTLDALAHKWADLAPGAEPSPEDVLTVRSLTGLHGLLDMLLTGVLARDHGRDRLADAYARITVLQMETIQYRASVGSIVGGLTLDAVAAAIDRGIGNGEMPPPARGLFVELRRRIPAGSDGAAGRGDADLDRLLKRIQALRAKTVEQGCTEQEALAAAEKVAELLDRHGLSLSEIDLRRQTCEGVGIATNRRRAGPVDNLVPAIAAFFDCRAWGEKTPTGAIRHVFFGLPGDVEAAQYLYDLIELTFETETRLFKSNDLYLELIAGERRGATNSFQVGLAHGIAEKLHRLRREREAALRRSNGGDLVVVKASVIEQELDKLGLSFKVQGRTTRKYVMTDAYEAGQAAGRRFDYRPGLADGSSAKRTSPFEHRKSPPPQET